MLYKNIAINEEVAQIGAQLVASFQAVQCLLSWAEVLCFRTTGEVHCEIILRLLFALSETHLTQGVGGVFDSV